MDNDKDPTDLLAAIKRAIKLHPHLRVGQLLCCALGDDEDMLFFVTNDSLLASVNNFADRED